MKTGVFAEHSASTQHSKISVATFKISEGAKNSANKYRPVLMECFAPKVRKHEMDEFPAIFHRELEITSVFHTT